MTFPVENTMRERLPMDADLSLFTWYGLGVWMRLIPRDLEFIERSKTGETAKVKDRKTGRYFIQTLDWKLSGKIPPGCLVQFVRSDGAVYFGD